MYKPTLKSYFCGGGIGLLGMVEGGLECIQSLELNETCCETLKLNYDHKILNDDISKVLVKLQDKSDVMFFTYPCKKYSSIADISGTRTGEELFLHAFRHMAIEQPEAYVIENVPGMKKFHVVMEAMTKLPGYYLNVFCPVDASNWLPQSRKRLIIIGTKRNIFLSPPQPTYNRTKLRDIIDSIPEMEIPIAVINRLKGDYRDLPIISDPGNAYELAPTCVAHYAKDKSTRLVVDKSHPMGVRPYSTREYARLQGVPDWYKFAGSDNDVYRQIGNGVPRDMAYWIAKQLVKYFN